MKSFNFEFFLFTESSRSLRTSALMRNNDMVIQRRRGSIFLSTAAPIFDRSQGRRDDLWFDSYFEVFENLFSFDAKHSAVGYLSFVIVIYVQRELLAVTPFHQTGPTYRYAFFPTSQYYAIILLCFLIYLFLLAII